MERLGHPEPFLLCGTREEASAFVAALAPWDVALVFYDGTEASRLQANDLNRKVDGLVQGGVVPLIVVAKDIDPLGIAPDLASRAYRRWAHLPPIPSRSA